MPVARRVILIGGTSHTGKSTFAQSIAEELGWQHLSTDQLARHPGRPWRADDSVPGDVADYYLSLTPEQMVESVLEHYRDNVWPIAEAIVQSRTNNPYDTGIVIEGSAIFPSFVRGLPESVSAHWLTLNHDTLVSRIHASSDYAARSARDAELIDRFVDRTLLFDDAIRASASEHELTIVDVGEQGAFLNLGKDLAAT